MRHMVVIMSLSCVLIFSFTASSMVEEELPRQAMTETMTPTEQVERLVYGELTYEEASADIKLVLDRMSAAKEADRAMKLTAWLAVLASLFKLLLSAVKTLGGFNFWKERQSAVIRIITLGLGVTVYFVSSIVGGMSWYEALFLSMSGPGAMVVHEYSRLFIKKPNVKFA